MEGAGEPETWASVREAAPRRALSSAAAEVLVPVQSLEVPPGRSRRREGGATDESLTRLPAAKVGGLGARHRFRELAALQPPEIRPTI